MIILFNKNSIRTDHRLSLLTTIYNYVIFILILEIISTKPLLFFFLTGTKPLLDSYSCSVVPNNSRVTSEN